MNFASFPTCPFFSTRSAIWFFLACILTLLVTAVASGQTEQIEGFTEPFRQIDLSSDESGAIATLLVKEGQQITNNQIVCKLDSSVQEIQVEIAKHLAEAKSQVKAAEESFQKRLAITERIETLKADGYATDSEKLRSDMELSIAKARMLSAKEDAQVREIEYRRAVLQLERRTIRAPFTGVVSKIHKREGEYLSPVSPEIITLIQIDRLIAKFNVPSYKVKLFKPGKEFNLTLYNGTTVKATVYTVSVHTDAQSSTVEVKLVIENPDNQIRAGEYLVLDV